MQPNHEVEAQKVKQYSQVYLDQLQHSDDYTVGMAPSQTKIHVHKSSQNTHEYNLNDTGSHLDSSDTDKYRNNFDLFADLFKNQANLLDPSSYYRQGCRQLIFIPSGLPQVSSMASIKNVKTNHNALHASSQLKKKKNL